MVRKPISFHEMLAVKLRFLANGDSYGRLQYLFIFPSKQSATSLQKCGKILLKN